MCNSQQRRERSEVDGSFLNLFPPSDEENLLEMEGNVMMVTFSPVTRFRLLVWEIGLVTAESWNTQFYPTASQKTQRCLVQS